MLDRTLQEHSIMATAVQQNGMQPLTNGNINNVENHEALDNKNDTRNNAEENNPYNHQPDIPIPMEEPEAQPEIDILIRNVVCSFSVRCHLNLREIALNGSNVEYRKENGMITMKLRRPYTTASIWSSGKVTCTGAETEHEAKVAARRIARSLQKLGFKVSYEPELHPGVTYKLKDPKATLKIFSTGSVTITAPNVAAVGAAIEQIFPLVYEFRKKRSPEDEQALAAKKLKNAARYRRDIIEDQDLLPAVIGSDDEEMPIESDASGD
ncbi:Similar to Tbpl1: TATA box-binding protein-like 1 (Mus musculus) [Cotesia congregata]|uniref:Similar to Tbpl1: TATA box-binding protein-like 1 (Mus musculus) n=1 Tax=Cotesia congregata TaxID=51543 RepID=A0A8J2HH17_COTCN|nr:Similar to Tbpl1: TATA box-binding protein-like 1 (Mus musculus) [Cotesia congregata]